MTTGLQAAIRRHRLNPAIIPSRESKIALLRERGEHDLADKFQASLNADKRLQASGG